ncbi:IQ domain-containing protein E isoform X2 [Cyprinodon tularosa]|uniref:IQ domain-containing protein E isoform X2 n=1 Tax=Cyprinodon tularosa TaxID=77115 RepID=UPI0018E26EB0|nr:IQ domain-containing protein E isoform X2 [Cyprinodon tularosa]
MFSETNKMSLEASDFPSDEDCEELVEDGFTLPADIPVKGTSRKKMTGKTLSSPRSPYLCSLNMNSKRAAVAAWRLPRSSLGDTRGDISREHCSARHTSLSNGHDVPYMLASESDSPKLLKHKSAMRKQHLLSFNGFTLGAVDLKDKESMYDEILHLKKSLQAQKSDNQQMKAKLRHLEEDNAKREKQIEELLDPTKGSEYTRSLVDKKKEGSVIVNGLKQRILKLEQQCREKENALSKLQSELRTTNLEELKMTVETYFEEIQRLRVLLDATEKSRAESKCSQRQQKALSSTVQRLAENVKHLQQENAALREELGTESPAAGIKGYKEWSRQRLLRRLLEVERRLEDSRRHTHSANGIVRLDKEVQATPVEAPGFTMATEAAVSVGTVTEQDGEVSALRENVGQLEEEMVKLQEELTNKNDELMQMIKERDELAKETEWLKSEQKEQLDRVEQQHRQELEQLLTRVQTLEDDRSKLVKAEVCLPPPTVEEHLEDAQHRAGQEEEEEKEKGEEAQRMDAEMAKKEKAALIIQTNWRRHRHRDTVMLQPAIRGHLFRNSWLKNNQKNTENKSKASLSSRNSADGGPDVAALTLIQSAFRGHLARCALATKSSGFTVPSPDESYPPDFSDGPSRKGSDYLGKNAKKEQDLDPVTNPFVSGRSHAQAQRHPRSTAELDADTGVESDDSDEIIVSPSRPLRRREVLLH